MPLGEAAGTWEQPWTISPGFYSGQRVLLIGQVSPELAGCPGSTPAMAKGSMPIGRASWRCREMLQWRTENQDGIEAMVDRRGRRFGVGSRDGGRAVSTAGKRRHRFQSGRDQPSRAGSVSTLRNG